MSDQNYDEIRDKIFNHLFLPIRPVSWYKEPGRLKVLTKGDGVHVTDIDGNTYLDGAAGWQYGNVGHGRKEIGEAIKKQIEELAIVAPEFGNIPCANLAEKIAQLAPGDLTKVAFCNSGSEAVETAMKIAKQYHVLNGDPGRFKVISRRGSYHGITWGCMSLMGKMRDMLSQFEPMVPMAIRVPAVYCYRCDYGLSYPSCNLQCAREIERVIENEGSNVISAVIADSASHCTNVTMPPPEYWPLVRSICDKHGVLIIDDEVVVGFGRTGKWFCYEHFNFTPDILCFAKGVTSGYIPLAGAIATTAVASKIDSGTDFGLANLPTWGGNPVSAAGALANIAIMERENLVENSAEVGKHMLEGLQDRLGDHRIVGDIRGLGLMLGVEMVADKKTKAVFSDVDAFVNKAYELMEAYGLIGRDFDTTIVLTPPLNLSKGDADEMVKIIGNIVDDLAKFVGH
ncbi:MAG: aspartate aminotransferase family protein [bacterium]|nr:aspartate aminotransferase family protein [bacterium]